MTATVPSLTDRLADAQLALHRLQTGQLAVEVDVGGYRTRFTATDIDKLQAYVGQLQAQINGTVIRGAIGIVF